MSLPAQYKKQETWRSWDTALAYLPPLRGRRVLDLGCGVGQITARLASMGAEAIGVDLNQELVDAARSAHPVLRIEALDLHQLTPQTFGLVDGIWASFVAAYFQDLPAIVSRWSECLSPGGWLMLIEIDDLLGHEPLDEALRQDVKQFYAHVKPNGYNFECGRELLSASASAGLTPLHHGVLPDRELSFQGAADDEILEAWRLRLQRMLGMQRYFGERFSVLEDALLTALSSTEHRSTASVRFVLSQKGM
jgi:SAM-dependent methyltransferase